MKKPKVLLMIAFGLAFAVSALGQSETDIFGYYSIIKPTKEFANISEIHLVGNYGAKETPKFYGLIRLKAKKAKDFQLLKPTLTGKTLTFSTTAVNGISYRFTGKFTRLDNFPELQPNGEVLLAGTLAKYRGKTRIALATVKLSYQAGD